MALLSCGARAAAAQRVQLLERWHDAYAATRQWWEWVNMEKCVVEQGT